MMYLFNYLTATVRNKLNWAQKVRKAMTEVDKAGKDFKSQSSRPSTSKLKRDKNKRPTSSVNDKSNLNSSRKVTKNKISTLKKRGQK